MSGSDLNISPLYKKTAVIGNLLMICPERVMDFVKIPRVQSDTSACMHKQRPRSHLKIDSDPSASLPFAIGDPRLGPATKDPGFVPSKILG